MLKVLNWLAPVKANHDIDENSLKVIITERGVKLDGLEQLIGHPVISKDIRKAINTGFGSKSL